MRAAIIDGWEHLAQTLRRLRRDAPFTAAFVATLALGLAANLAVLSAIDAYFLRPLPYPQGGRLIDIYFQTAKFPLPPGSMSGSGYEALQRLSALSASGLMDDWGNVTVSIPGEPPANDQVAAVTASLLQTLDVAPLLGRWISPAGDRPDGPPEVDLSFGLWQSAFHGDPHVLGDTVRISGGLFTVVGVMPPDFAFPTRRTQLWVGMVLTPQSLSAKNTSLPYVMIARLKPGASQAEIGTGIDGALARLEHAMPPGLRAGYQQVGVYMAYLPLRAWMAGATRGRLLMMQLGAGILLLLTVASLANLALARALRRRDEAALRVVLGAGRRLLLTHALLEALPLGAAAIFIAWPLTELGIGALAHYGIISLSTSLRPHVGYALWVLGFVVALALSIAALALPIAFAPVNRPAELLYGIGKGASRGHRVRPLRLALSVGQVGLAIALLAGALLIGRSLRNMLDPDPGFDSRHLYAAMLLLQGPRYGTWGAWLEAHQRLAAAVAALPGVSESGIGEAVPFSTRGAIFGFTPAQGRTAGTAKALGAITLAGPSLMQTLGVHLLAGRLLDAHDAAADATNVVIDERLADTLFGNPNVVGKNINCSLGTCRIVGVIGTIKDGFAEHYSFANGAIFAPEELTTFKERWDKGGNMTVLIRSSESPANLAREVTRAVHRALPDQSLIAFAPMQELISDAAQGTAALASLLIAFGALAFTLATIGTYGVLAYVTGLRRREFAVRQAVGAEPVQIESLVLRQGFLLWVLGSAVGVACALTFAGSLAEELYGVSLFSPATYALPAIVVGAAVMLASWIPARGARKLDLIAQIRPE